jgi:hypothetical protein
MAVVAQFNFWRYNNSLLSSIYVMCQRNILRVPVMAQEPEVVTPLILRWGRTLTATPTLEQDCEAERSHAQKICICIEMANQKRN